jgi:hypothetical protein
MNRIALLTVLAAVAVAACEKSPSSAAAPAAACLKEGDRCEYAAGKIGLCTAKPDGCDGGSCLVCMSLH